jgi:hypothetical protein
MQRESRSLVELTSWLTQHLEKFFATVSAAHEFAGQLEALEARELDITFPWADLYDLRFFPDLLTTEPRGILPPGYDSTEPEIRYTFAIWFRRTPPRDVVAEDVLKETRRHVVPDLFTYDSQGVARRRLARLAEILERRIGGHSFQHFATVPSAGELVSVFVDRDSLERVAAIIE